MCWVYVVSYFLFKQKTAYELRISDWSSDVCSSDLANLNRVSSGPTDFSIESAVEPLVSQLSPATTASYARGSASPCSTFRCRNTKSPIANSSVMVGFHDVQQLQLSGGCRNLGHQVGRPVLCGDGRTLKAENGQILRIKRNSFEGAAIGEAEDRKSTRRLNSSH